jgi:hypothetical protein
LGTETPENRLKDGESVSGWGSERKKKEPEEEEEEEEEESDKAAKSDKCEQKR